MRPWNLRFVIELENQRRTPGRKIYNSLGYEVVQIISKISSLKTQRRQKRLCFASSLAEKVYEPWKICIRARVIGYGPEQRSHRLLENIFTDRIATQERKLVLRSVLKKKQKTLTLYSKITKETSLLKVKLQSIVFYCFQLSFCQLFSFLSKVILALKPKKFMVSLRNSGDKKIIAYTEMCENLKEYSSKYMVIF